MIFYSHAKKKSFSQDVGLAFSLVLKVKDFGTLKWPIDINTINTHSPHLFSSRPPPNTVKRGHYYKGIKVLAPPPPHVLYKQQVGSFYVQKESEQLVKELRDGVYSLSSLSENTINE